MCTFLNSNGLLKEHFQLEIDYFIKKYEFKMLGH